MYVCMYVCMYVWGKPGKHRRRLLKEKWQIAKQQANLIYGRSLTANRPEPRMNDLILHIYSDLRVHAYHICEELARISWRLKRPAPHSVNFSRESMQTE